MIFMKILCRCMIALLVRCEYNIENISSYNYSHKFRILFLKYLFESASNKLKKKKLYGLGVCNLIKIRSSESATAVADSERLIDWGVWWCWGQSDQVQLTGSEEEGGY